MSTPTLQGQGLTRPAQCPIQVFSSQKHQCPSASVQTQADATCPRQQGAPEAEARATRGGGSTPHRPGAAAEGAGPGVPLRNMSDMMLRDAKIPNSGPTAHFSARTQTHPEGSEPRRVSVRRPGAGGSATPPPQAITGRGAGAEEHGVEWARSPGTSVVISQHGPQRGEQEGGREGGTDRGLSQEAPPTCPPCALRHQAGTGTLGRSRLEGQALRNAAGSRASHSAAGEWLSRGPLAG